MEKYYAYSKKILEMDLFYWILWNFFPNYLFAFAETVIDSSVAAVLNGMTPLFTLLIGVIFLIQKLNMVKFLE